METNSFEKKKGLNVRAMFFLFLPLLILFLYDRIGDILINLLNITHIEIDLWGTYSAFLDAFLATVLSILCYIFYRKVFPKKKAELSIPIWQGILFAIVIGLGVGGLSGIWLSIVDFLASHSSQTLHFDNSVADELKFDDNTRIRETRYKLSGYLGSSDDLFVHKAAISHIKTDNDTTQYKPWVSSVDKAEYDSKKLNTNYQLDINFDREGEVKQAVSLLADYQNTKYVASAYNFVDKKLTEKSIAAEYRLFTESDHSLSISGRYTDNSLFENAFTARLAGAYRLSQNVKAHASIGKAIHNPTFIDVYGWGNSTSWAANPNLKPEKSLGGELGLLVESNDKRHSLDTTLFVRNVDNFLDAIPLNNTYTLYRSINRGGKTKIKGVEISYNGKFSESLSGYANYTYTYIKSENDQYGLNYVRRPKHTGNLGLAYQITEKLGSDVNVSYVGKRLDSGDFKMPSYTLANLGVNYKVADSLTIYANLNNVFNKKYENVLGYGQEGRNVYVGLKGSF